MRVVIAEDEILLREGLGLVLDRLDFEVVGTAGDAEELLRKVSAHAPDLVITDIRMPPSHTDEGLRAAMAIRSAHHGVAVLVLSQHVQITYALELFEEGATGLGYLLKQRIMDVARFGADLRALCAGGTVLDPEVVSTMLAARRHDVAAKLTPRQQQVLVLMAKGRTNAAIGRELSISEKAVVRHASHIYDALGLANTPDDHRRVQAVLRHLAGTP